MSCSQAFGISLELRRPNHSVSRSSCFPQTSFLSLGPSSAPSSLPFPSGLPPRPPRSLLPKPLQFPLPTPRHFTPSNAPFLSLPGPVDGFLSHPSWQPISRVTYSTYLVAMQIQYLTTYTSKAPFYFTPVNVVSRGRLSQVGKREGG